MFLLNLLSFCLNGFLIPLCLDIKATSMFDISAVGTNCFVWLFVQLTHRDSLRDLIVVSDAHSKSHIIQA